MNIKLDGETADAIVVDSLKFHMKMTEKEIKKQMKVKNMTACQQSNLGYDVNMLDCMTKVFEYYGGSR